MVQDFFARDRDFWNRMGRAIVIGALAGGAALAFTQIVRFGTALVWPEDIDYGWMGGEWWWAALLGITGLIVIAFLPFASVLEVESTDLLAGYSRLRYWPPCSRWSCAGPCDAICTGSSSPA